MKTLKFFALVGLFLFTLFKPTVAERLEQTSLDEIPNYVVIGAFAIHKNAIRFTNHAQKDLKLDAKFQMNRQRRNLYYVYVLSTQDLPAAILEARRLRAESEFTDTWVYRGSFTDDLTSQNQPQAEDINPMVELKTADGKTAETSSELKTADTSAAANTVVKPDGQTGNIDSTSSSESSSLPSGNLTGTPDDGKEGTKFFFKILRQADMKPLNGDVDVIDVDRTRKMGTYKGNLTVKIASPGNRTGKMSIVCEVFGYRKVQRDMNYNDPEAEADIIRDGTGSVVVPFELTRLKKGDIAVMYNVYFFKDASIMRPESRYEVNSLLEMLNENLKYKIKIHGHTNGNAAGKIISMNNKSQNFFSLNDTREGFGSAKQLSEERAIIIRDYLINSGIDGKRMEVKAWGGKRPIHDKMSNRAQENVRVEVEILED